MAKSPLDILRKQASQVVSSGRSFLLGDRNRQPTRTVSPEVSKEQRRVLSVMPSTRNLPKTEIAQGRKSNVSRAYDAVPQPIREGLFGVPRKKDFWK